MGALAISENLQTIVLLYVERTIAIRLELWRSMDEPRVVPVSFSAASQVPARQLATIRGSEEGV